MNRISTYKTLITAFLIAVYGFIATPVQYWHQHSNVTTSSAEKVSTPSQSESVAELTNQVLDANCKVCSHHYAMFVPATFLQLEAPLLLSQSVEETYILSIPSSPLLCFTNKGPPASV